MQAVYFGQELHARAPSVMGVLCVEPVGKQPEWIGLGEIVDAMDKGEVIIIRPASADEMKRAANMVALYDVGRQLSERLDDLLDKHEPEDVRRVKSEINSTVASIPFTLLD